MTPDSIRADVALRNASNTLRELAKKAIGENPDTSFVHGMGLYVTFLAVLPLAFPSEEHMRQFTNGFMSMVKLAGPEVAPHQVEIMRSLADVIEKFALSNQYLTEDEAQRVLDQNPEIEALWEKSGVSLDDLYNAEP